MLTHKGTLNFRIDGVPYRKSFTLDTAASIPQARLIGETSPVPEGFVYRLGLEPERKTRLEMESFSLTFILPAEVESCFLNGFQSWTESGERSPSSAQKPFNSLASPWVKSYHLKKYGDQHFCPCSGRTGEFHGYTYGYLRHPDRMLTLAASLDEQKSYTRILFRIHPREKQVEITVECECAGMVIDRSRTLLSFFLGSGSQEEVFSRWQQESESGCRPNRPVTGWTSWYNHYRGISEQIVLKNLKTFSERGIPLDIFQIDDGWQAAVGDWLSVNEKFPDGLGTLARTIRKAGYSPGLWIAPFIAEESSALCRDHADWILRDEHGPVIAGNNPFYWSGLFYSLDISHPEVKEYLRFTLRTILDNWGFEMIKADFLYAAALVPKHGRSRGEIMHEAVTFLREIMGSRLLLSCGVPLGSVFGLTDYCRIGADVGPRWEDRKLLAARFPERISTKNSLTSTIGRGHLNTRFFFSDPDVFILRDDNTRLSQAEKQVLFLVNHLFGSLVFTSDDIDSYSEKTLALYCSAFPLVEKHIVSVHTENDLASIEFRIRRRSYIAFINLSGKTRRIRLPGDSGTAWYSEATDIRPGGWELKLRGIDAKTFIKVPARPWSVIGTTGRLFPASEIDQVFKEENELMITFRQGTLMAGDVIVRLPRKTELCMVNNNSALIEEQYGITIGRASLI